MDPAKVAHPTPEGLFLQHLVADPGFARHHVTGDGRVANRSADLHLAHLLPVAIDVQPLSQGGHPPQGDLHEDKAKGGVELNHLTLNPFIQSASTFRGGGIG
jgi:hypothetical protein